MTSARKHKTRGAARRMGRPGSTPAPAPPAEGWRLMSTSVPHLRDAPWAARLALATVEKVAILVAVVVLGCGLLAAVVAGWVPAFLGMVLRWLLKAA